MRSGLDYSDTHKEIIVRIKNYDKIAQYQLYQLYAKAMYNTCYRMMNNKEEAEDMLQESFIDHDASQCGFCTSGMIMTASHLLDKNPNPDLHEVKHALSGNYCRCGTHPHVFKATIAAAKKTQTN